MRVRVKMTLLFLLVLACSNLHFGQVQQQSVPTPPQNIRFSNTSSLVGKGQYKWTIYLDADQSVLDQIKSVEYLLHPSFDNPDREVTDPRKGPRAFSTSGTALRPAKIGIAIHYKNGGVRTFEYTLRLRSSFSNLWYVVVGYYGWNQKSKAQEIAKAYQAQSFNARAIDTNSGDFPNFDRGVWMVVIGPYTRSQAQASLKKIPVLAGKLYIQQAATS
jgi:hypothetical protein